VTDGSEVKDAEKVVDAGEAMEEAENEDALESLRLPP
jgi:hypothetical protein